MTVAYSLSPVTPRQAEDIAGLPHSTAVMWFTLPDTNTDVPIYEGEDSGDGALTNPVPADAEGVIPAVYVSPTLAYRVRLFSTPDVTDTPLFDVTIRPQVSSASNYDVGTSGAKLGLLNADKTDSGDNQFTGDNDFSGETNISGPLNATGEVSLPIGAEVNGQTVGYRGIPVDEITTDVTLTQADNGKCKRKSGSAELEITFPELEAGSVFLFSNDNATGNLLLVRDGTAMRLAGVLTDDDLTVAPWGEGSATYLENDVIKVRGTLIS